jgi:hypothetical protein
MVERKKTSKYKARKSYTFVKVVSLKMETDIQAQLQAFLATHSIPNPPFADHHRRLLSEWRIELRTLASCPAGLTRVRGMVVDEAEGGLAVGYFLKDGALFTTKYGTPIPEDAELVESVLLKRNVLVCSQVPGDPDSLKNEVLFVPHEETHFAIGSIVDVYGVWRDDEFHMLACAEDPVCDLSSREALLGGLTSLIGRKAAMWVMFSLMSSVSERNLLVGKLVVNLMHADSQELVSFLSAVTRTVYVPLTIAKLNSQCFIPKKNYQTDRLESNLLLVPKHTLFVLDENTLEPGTLNEQGLRNVQALQRLINLQTVGYDYTYYTHEMEVDYRVLVLSEGKSMFKCDLSLSVERQGPLATEVSAARNFLQSIGTTATIDKDLQEVAQKFFCSRRALGDYSPEDFSRLLTAATYHATSLRKLTVDMEDWEVALGL